MNTTHTHTYARVRVTNALKRIVSPHNTIPVQETLNEDQTSFVSVAISSLGWLMAAGTKFSWFFFSSGFVVSSWQPIQQRECNLIVYAMFNDIQIQTVWNRIPNWMCFCRQFEYEFMMLYTLFSISHCCCKVLQISRSIEW